MEIGDQKTVFIEEKPGADTAGSSNLDYRFAEFVYQVFYVANSDLAASCFLDAVAGMHRLCCGRCFLFVNDGHRVSALFAPDDPGNLRPGYNQNGVTDIHRDLVLFLGKYFAANRGILVFELYGVRRDGMARYKCHRQRNETVP
jgi:hypothetical protein